MNPIVEYTANFPLILRRLNGDKVETEAIPEGGSVGFNLDNIFVKNKNGNWQGCLTPKFVFVNWMDHGFVKEKHPHQKKLLKTLAQKVAAYKQKAKRPAEGVHPEEEGVLAKPTDLPPLHQPLI